MHLLVSRGVNNSECLGVASSHDRGGALQILNRTEPHNFMHTAVLSRDEDKSNRQQIGISNGISAVLPSPTTTAPLNDVERAFSKAGGMGHQIVIAIT